MAVAVGLALTLLLAGCSNSGSAGNNGSGSSSGNSPGNQPGQGSGQSSASKRKYPLNQLPTSTITANGKTIRVWLATDEARREEGLMFVPPEEIADDQGMLFVFPNEQPLSFWMRNTITPLDIAYARQDGVIVKTWRMPPQTLQTFPSGDPAMFALEMKAGAFERYNIRQGDRLVIPDDVFKRAP